MRVLAKWSLLPLAGAGMLLAHEATYRLAAHDHGHPEELLAATGHSWTGYSGTALTLLAVLSVAAGWFTATRRSAVPSLWKLAAIQTGLFWLVEVLERALSGHHPVPQASILVIGALAQLPVAMLVWLLFARVVVPTFAALAGLRPVGVLSAPARMALRSPVVALHGLSGVFVPDPRGPPALLRVM